MINSAVLIEYMTVKTSEHGIYRAIACAIHVRIAHAPSAPGGKWSTYAYMETQAFPSINGL